MSTQIDQVKHTVSRITEGLAGRLTESPKAVAAGALGLVAAAAGAYAIRRNGVEDSTPFHVVSNGDGWQIRNENSGEVVASYGTKRDAVREGRRLADQQRPSSLVIHKTDGEIARTHTYRTTAD